MPSGDDKNIGKDSKLSEISSLRMADGDGRIVLHKHQGHRLADDVTGPNYDDICSLKRNFLMFEQFQYAIWCARWENSPARHQCTNIIKMESIDILVDGDRVKDARNIKGPRQWQLHEDAMNEWILV